jgi:hypothetical protein
MTVASPVINQNWVVAELVKLVDAEYCTAGGTGPNPKTPPHESLSCVYHEMAAADERHAETIKTIATRYGYVPVRGGGGGIGEAFGRLRDQFAALGSGPIDRLMGDLLAKAQAIHRYTAWAQLFETMGDSTSRDDLAAITAEEQVHLDALQTVLNRLVEEAARAE